MGVQTQGIIVNKFIIVICGHPPEMPFRSSENAFLWGIVKIHRAMNDRLMDPKDRVGRWVAMGDYSDIMMELLLTDEFIRVLAIYMFYD